MKFLITLSLLIMLSNTMWSQNTWLKTFGGWNDDRVLSLTTTSEGGIVLMGYTRSNSGDFKGMNKGGGDIFIMKLDSNGNLKPSGKRKSKKK